MRKVYGNVWTYKGLSAPHIAPVRLTPLMHQSLAALFCSNSSRQRLWCSTADVISSAVSHFTTCILLFLKAHERTNLHTQTRNLIVWLVNTNQLLGAEFTSMTNLTEQSPTGTGKPTVAQLVNTTPELCNTSVRHCNEKETTPVPVSLSVHTFTSHIWQIVFNTIIPQSINTSPKKFTSFQDLRLNFSLFSSKKKKWN